ncbi:hypothetical protein Hypma_000534 [Hypsizygus marmoreus]|uniref:Uncharacterized protein n=1 Tax=Hypsizygus marmoreus TaxID=39966 RepID=A0A369JHK6_HYPMA|nr:hypothetical protein Hypma_000534 [Hypsizygus marmoreus]
MGIGSTIKSMLGEEDPAVTQGRAGQNTTQDPGQSGNTTGSSNFNPNNSNKSPATAGFGSGPATTGNHTNSGSGGLPAGTGPGTTGKGGASAPSHHTAGLTHERHTQSGTGETEFAGGGGGPTHNGANEPDYNSTCATGMGSDRGRKPGVTGASTATNHQQSNVTGDEQRIGQRSGVTDSGTHHRHHDSGIGSGLSTGHTFGHHQSNDTSMPSKDASNDSHQLDPVTHEKVRHHETEEVLRQRDHDRHIHHVQHHTQPVVDKDVREERHHDKVHPTTHINESHTNSSDDKALFHGQVGEHQHSLEHGAKERTIIDRGEDLNESQQHHVHHVVQPVIEKETHDQHRIHTTIPIHQVTHEAPVVHQSQTHNPVSMEHFSQKGGALSGGLSHDQIGEKVLHGGECTRQVDGEGETLARNLIGNNSGGGFEGGNTGNFEGRATDNSFGRGNNEYGGWGRGHTGVHGDEGGHSADNMAGRVSSNLAQRGVEHDASNVV